MTEAQAWKTDILDNSTSTPQELPMMVLVNKRESETEHGLEHNDDGQESEMNEEYLSDIALKNGFTSWYNIYNNNFCYRFMYHTHSFSVVNKIIII